VRYVAPRHVVIDGTPAPVPFWQPDRAFAGLTVVIVGGGPSHADLDLDRLRGRRFIAINSACRTVRPAATSADMLFFTDNSWNENRPDLAAGWPGPVVTSNRNAKARLGAAVHRLDLEALTRFIGVRSDYVQASSAHTAACLAALMGAARLALVGVECRLVDGRSHGHDDYSMHDTAPFAERFIPGWNGLAPAFRRLGVEVVNCTPGSAVDCFQRMDLDEAFRRTGG
jgi:hypothetical protein